MKSLSGQQKVRNLSENNDIPEEPENSGLLLLLFKSNNFSFLIHIIDNIINTSVSFEQNSHQ